MRLGSLNSISLRISHDLQMTQRALARALQRMSSGSSLEGGDDPVKLHQSTSLTASIRGFRQSILSLNSTQAVLETASAGLRSQLEIVQKMKELAVQAGSGILSSTERQGIQTQLVELRKEFESISKNSRFGDMNLLDGSTNSFGMSVGGSGMSSLDYHLESSTSSDIFRKNEALNSFQSADTFSHANGGVAVLADINGDGTKDLVSIDSGSKEIRSSLFDENGTIIGTKTTVAIDMYNNLLAKDLNGDGLEDLLIGVDVYLSNGDGSFSSEGSIAEDEKPNSTIYFSNQNGDGIDDLVYINGDGDLVVRLGNADGSFQPAITTSVAFFNHLRIGDINNDGFDDIAFQSGGARVSWAFSNGDGTFQALQTINTVLPSITDLAMGNITGDAGADLVIMDGPNTMGSTYTGSAAGLVLPTFDFYSMNLTNLRIIDWDGNGVGDLVGSTGTSLHVFSSSGAGVKTYAAGASISQILFADLSGDGFEDFITLSNAGESFSLFERNKKNIAATGSLSVLDLESAQTSLEILNNAEAILIQKLSRIEIQAGSSEHYKSFLANQQASHEDAQERLLAVDLAQEMAELVRNQILQQAQMAALAQANLQARVVLKLLSDLSD